MGVVRRGLGRGALRGDVASGHAAIDNEVGAVDEAALVAGEEEDGLGLLDGFAEAAGWEVDGAARTLDFVVSEPVLEEGSAGMVRFNLGRGKDVVNTHFKGAGQSALKR